MRLVLLGDPVAHSLSPVIHRTALEAAGLTGSYEARRVDVAGLAEAIDEIRRGDIDGANVTMPLKRLAYELADEVVDEAQRAGAVNTLFRDGGAVIGANTDIAGIRVAWAAAGLPATGRVFVLGAGGAAAAALLGLRDHSLAVSARRKEAGRALLEALRLEGDVIEWGSPPTPGVIVNATPIGMQGESLPAAVLDAATGLFDMAYGRSVTPAVDTARQRGIPTAEGVDMLVAQAAASFRLWTGQEASMEAMKRAVRTHLDSPATD